MTFNSFERLVEDYLKSRFEGCKVEVRDVLKNNDVVLRGVTVFFDDINAAPTIYLDDLYESFAGGTELEVIYKKCEDILNKARLCEDIDIDCLTDKEWIQKNIYAKLINTVMNYELLETVPHIEFLDLAIVFYLKLEMGDNSYGTVLVTNEMLERAGMNYTKKKYAENIDCLVDDNTCLYALANENTLGNLGSKLISFKDLVKEILPDNCNMEECIMQNNYTCHIEDVKGIPDMYVLTNEERSLGAINMLNKGILCDIAKIIDGDFYIIPSSIHEVIILPVNEAIDVEDLEDMVSEVNFQHVAPSEVLSYSVYIYRKEKGRLEVA